MKEFSRCPSCGCTVDDNLVGHHSAIDCSILKYAERHDDEIRRECAERAWNYVALRATSQTFGMGLTKHDMESAIMGKE